MDFFFLAMHICLMMLLHAEPHTVILADAEESVDGDGESEN